jgi:hypothetical protein
MNAVPK